MCYSLSVKKNTHRGNWQTQRNNNRKKDVVPPTNHKLKTTNYLEGLISISAKGAGYLRPIRSKPSQDSGDNFNIAASNRASVPDRRDETILIEHEDLKTALHGDIVRVQILGKQRDITKAKVTEIISRGKVGFAGTLKKDEEKFVLSPSDKRMYKDILIGKDHLGGAKVGEKVFAMITHWENQEDMPEGKILRSLGMPGENNAEMLSLALEKGFDALFPPDVEHEAQNLRKNFKIKEDIQHRRDMRGVPTFTIDPDDAKDFDDALSFVYLPNGDYEIGIHIADVSYFVRPGSALDIEARRRGTSVYLVDRTIPMLPEILSNDLCRLNPDEDKYIKCTIFVI